MLKIPANIRRDVSSIIGDPSSEHFYHKGQAATRNLSYLKLLQIKRAKKTRKQKVFKIIKSCIILLTAINSFRSIWHPKMGIIISMV